jgi:branched-chain amino acid transport system substrate-binding protein
MLDKKMIAMLMTLSMLAASLAGCLGGDDWEADPADDLSADIVTSAWDPIIPNLNDGEMCDAIISAMTKTDERDQVVDFTRGYYTSSQGVIGAAGSASISDVSELNAAGTTIAVQSGTTSDLYAQDNLGMATIVAYDDFPSVTAAVSNGEADYAMGDSPVLALSGDLMTTFSDETFGIAVREDSGELLDALNVAITAIVDSGEYDAIFAEWFDGAVVLTDDRDADTATSYPEPSKGSTLTAVLEAGSLKFCSDTAYPPFENLDENGNAVGFDVDIANALVDEIAAHYMGTDNPMFDVTADAVTIKLGFLNDATGPISQFAAPFTYAWGAAMADLNAMGDDYVFEVIEADSGCNGETATAAAQTLADAGVVAVAGAACSGASMGANAVLSAAGIPMISYASTSPALSDATAYPHFYRIVPSDALQGEAVADMIMASGAMNTAIVHMTNDYGAGLADSVATNLGSDHVCTQLGYDQETTTDFQSAVQAVIEAGCDSVFLGSYSADGADIVETMAVMGAAIPIFSADGMAGEASLNDYTNPAVANGIQVTKPAAASASTTTFTDACAADNVCSGGIYQSEAYDAVMMLGHAAMMEDGANMGMHVPMVGSGDGYDGETGTHVFLDNGDVGGSGYDVCTFHHVPTYGDYFNCDKMWSVTSNGVVDAPWMGTTVKIGFLNDATGPIAVYADGFVAASQIALGLVNTVGFSSGVQFEIVYADSGCNGETGTSAAQSLVDAGVWGVVGAACSGASMGANSVLSAAGVPQISYASTSPALSDATAYPGFFRVVPSDAEQGQAMAAVATADGMDNIAVVHMTNDYGAGLADAFVSNMDASHICTQLGYAEDTTDFASAVEAVSNAGCTSVFLVSYATDGAMILEEMATQGVNIPVYGGDGIAEEGLAAGMADASIVDGVIASKPSAGGSMSEVQMVFAALCGAHPDCAGGIYTAEAFDAITMMALSAFTYLTTPGLDAGMAVMAVGQGWDGASGTLSFMANGDVPSSGFCIGEFSHNDGGTPDDASDDSVSYDCVRQWDIINGITTNSA